MQLVRAWHYERQVHDIVGAVVGSLLCQSEHCWLEDNDWSGYAEYQQAAAAAAAACRSCEGAIHVVGALPPVSLSLVPSLVEELIRV